MKDTATGDMSNVSNNHKYVLRRASKSSTCRGDMQYLLVSGKGLGMICKHSTQVCHFESVQNRWEDWVMCSNLTYLCKLNGWIRSLLWENCLRLEFRMYPSWYGNKHLAETKSFTHAMIPRRGLHLTCLSEAVLSRSLTRLQIWKHGDGEKEHRLCETWCWLAESSCMCTYVQETLTESFAFVTAPLEMSRAASSKTSVTATSVRDFLANQWRGDLPFCEE